MAKPVGRTGAALALAVTVLASGCGGSSHRPTSAPPSTDTPGDQAVCARLGQLLDHDLPAGLRGQPGASTPGALATAAVGAPSALAAALRDLSHAFAVEQAAGADHAVSEQAVDAATANIGGDFTELQRFVDAHCPGLRKAAST